MRTLADLLCFDHQDPLRSVHFHNTIATKNMGHSMRGATATMLTPPVLPYAKEVGKEYMGLGRCLVMIPA